MPIKLSFSSVSIFDFEQVNVCQDVHCNCLKYTVLLELNNDKMVAAEGEFIIPNR